MAKKIELCYKDKSGKQIITYSESDIDNEDTMQDFLYRLFDDYTDPNRDYMIFIKTNPLEEQTLIIKKSEILYIHGKGILLGTPIK